MSRTNEINNYSGFYPQILKGDNTIHSLKGLWSNTMNRPARLKTSTLKFSIIKSLQCLLAILLVSTLYGCGNSVSNGENPNGTSFTGANTGQVLTADQVAFQENLHRPIFRNYCTVCHEPGGSGRGQFSDRLDIVNAYNNAVDFVDRDDPANSRFVSKVLGGGAQQPHHCWVMVDDVADCAQSVALLTSAISNWVNADQAAIEAEIAADSSDTAEDIDIVSLLNAPPDAVPVAEQIVLGDTPGAGQNDYVRWVWGDTSAPYLSKPQVLPTDVARCVRCHSESAPQAQRQQPYFADSDPQVAFAALVETRKIDINTPTNSRIYLRLLQDSHNCWSDCSSDADTVLAAIEGWKNEILSGSFTPPTVDGDGETPISQGLELRQGQILSGGDRYRRNLVALWEFKAGSGSTIVDSSGVSPQLDLTLQGTEKDPNNPDAPHDYAWVGGYGVEFKGGYARGNDPLANRKIYDLIAPRNAYTIEAWVVPSDTQQEGPAIIASYSTGSENRNFSMGQTLYSYEFLNRNTNSGLDPASTANGAPTLITDPDDEDLQATQQHVVMTYDSVNGRQIYINGQLTGDNDPPSLLGGTLNDWNDAYSFVLGAEANGTNSWNGKIRLAAIYSRALTQEQVTQNFEAGVGEKFNLLFKIGHLTTQLPDESYIWFEAAEFDDNGYLFANPKFVVRGTNPSPATINVTIGGIRIGVNGIEAPVGQVYQNLNKSVSMSFPLAVDEQAFEPLIDSTTINTIDATTRSVPVNATGTVISKINGPDATPPDQFYLTIQTLTGAQFSGSRVIDPDPVPVPGIAYNYNAPTPGLADSTYISGIRTFEEINATMSELTGVAATNSSVRPIYLGITQQLPNSPAMEGFLASHQVAIAKLALGYCGELVDNSGSTFFAGFPFNEPPSTAFDTTNEQNIIVNALYDNMIINNIESQPTRTELSNILFEVGDPAVIGDGGLLERLGDECLSDPQRCPPDDAARTQTIVKSMCVTVLSSAAITAQ